MDHSAPTCSELHAQFIAHVMAWPQATHLLPPAQCAIAFCNTDLTSDRRTMPPGFPTAIDDMLKREKEHADYHAFYHGNCAEYAIYLRMTQRLYQRRHNCCLPDDHVLLRSPDSRTWLERVCAHDLEVDSADGDHTLEMREALLPVSYTPFQTSPSESAWYFCMFNYGMGTAYRYFISRLMISYGYLDESVYEIAATEIQRIIGERFFTDPRLFLKYGLMLQILVHDHVVDECTYDSWPYGRRRAPDLTGLRRSDLIRDAQIAVLDQAQNKSANGKASKGFSDAQARILLKPSLFDHPNEQVKIKLYTFFTPEEQRRIDCTCDAIEETCAQIMRKPN